ncbi:unnamed protein product [Effrenium voratum]|nr:unnamed protein product [Effrenium voratum]
MRRLSQRRVPVSDRACPNELLLRTSSARGARRAVKDTLGDLTDSGTDEPRDLEDRVTEFRIAPRVVRICGLRGLAAGPMGAGLVKSRTPGFGKGVPPASRIEQCVAVAFSEADARLEGGRFFVLTAAHDGYNLTWVPTVVFELHAAGRSEVPGQHDEAGWQHVALLPFRSVFSKFEGLASKPPRRKATAVADMAADTSHLASAADPLTEELKQQGLEGVPALIFVLAKLYVTPENVFQSIGAENGQVNTVQLEAFFRRLRQDVEALTGLKAARLFRELDVRGNGFVTLEDLGCSSTDVQKSLPCQCEGECISQVWTRVAGKQSDEFGRDTSCVSGTASSGLTLKTLKTKSTLRFTKQARSRRHYDRTSDDGASRTTRGENVRQRRNEVMRRERESCEVQDTHLDLERERFITTVQRTTVLHPLDYTVSRKAWEEMESKTRLVQRLAAEAEAAFARNRGGSHGEEAKDEASAPGPNTPRTLLEISKQRTHFGTVTMNLEPEVDEIINFTSITKSAQAKRLARATKQASEPPNFKRERLEVSSLAVDPLRPRVAAGIGDGQLAVYYLFRSHGSKRKQLHQIQGFDASRGVGDVATAVCLPSRQLSEEGSLAVETVLAGFESGRVAVYRTFFPEDFTEKGDLKTLEEVMEERQRIKSLANGEPVLQAEEPLLLEHYHCDSPIVALFWHQIMGIFSISSSGHVVVADSCAVKTFSIPEACGRNATVTSADMSSQLEQLAVAGQRGVHLWQTLSQAKYGVVGLVQDGSEDQNPEQNLNVMLVRYTPSGNFLLTLHKDRGDVKLWDARGLELHCSVSCGRLVDCAFWEPRWETLLVFTPSGVMEVELHEEAVEPEAQVISATRHYTMVTGVLRGERTGGPVRAKADLLGDSGVPRRNRPATASPGRPGRTSSVSSRPNSRPPSPQGRPASPARDPAATYPPAPGDRTKVRSLTSHMRRAPSPTPAFNKGASGKPRWRS